MKKIFLLCAASILLTSLFIVSCSGGQSPEEKERIEKERADSIKKAEEALRLQLEQNRLDSIAHAKELHEKWMADSIAAAKLLPSFKIIKDDKEVGTDTYIANGINRNAYSTAAYLSFTMRDGKRENLNLNVSVYSRNEVFSLTNAILYINGDEGFNLSLQEEQALDGRVEGGTYNMVAAYCEHYIQSINNSFICDKILEAEKIEIKLVGDSGEKRLKLSAKDIEKMKETILLYRLMP